MLADAQTALEEEGAEISEDASERSRTLVAKALTNRHLSASEEARLAETNAILEQTEEQVDSESQKSKIQMLVALAVALVILILAFKMGGDDD